MNFRNLKVFIVLLMFTASYTIQAQVDRRVLDIIHVKSTVLDEDRPIYVSKPTRYDKSDEKYFVVYVLDGNLYGNLTEGTLELMYQDKYPRILLVEVVSTFRNEDLTPAPWREAPGGGGADRFLKFMKTELIPYIDKNYRTNGYNVLVGHSLGGLFAAHTLYRDADLFDAYLAISPSVFWEEDKPIRDLRNFFKKTPSLKSTFYFAVGNEPGAEGDGIHKMHKMFQKEAPKDLDWKFDVFHKENHNTVPLKATMDGLRFIFGDLVLSDEVVLENGIDFAIDYYKKIEKKYSISMKVPQRTFMNYGWKLMEEGKNEEALDVFNKFILIYKEMMAGYDSRSYIYERLGKIDLAIKDVETIISFLPGDKDFQVRLKDLIGKKKK